MKHKRRAALVLADGQVFEGYSIGAEGLGVGELVFNTAMTGYQEILTDPSYAQQIIMLTAAHIGNTGWNEEDMESRKIWASALVVRESMNLNTHYRSQCGLSDYLQKQGIPAIAGLDTRQLTLYLREKGAIGACVTTTPERPEEALALAQSFAGLAGQDLASQGSVAGDMSHWQMGQGRWATVSKPRQYRVVVYDFGVKHNILRWLVDHGCEVTLVTDTASAEAVLALKPDGIVLSNGPGDPQACEGMIATTRHLVTSGIPLLGICLGFQILSLAMGGRSYKMPFGHHGANHPVVGVEAAHQVFITSQNHGFAIDESSLPADVVVTHRSLFDKSLQGIRHQKWPVLGFQGHPEASPGPHDMAEIFESFASMMQLRSLQ